MEGKPIPKKYCHRYRFGKYHNTRYGTSNEYYGGINARNKCWSLIKTKINAPPTTDETQDRSSAGLFTGNLTSNKLNRLDTARMLLLKQTRLQQPSRPVKC